MDAKEVLGVYKSEYYDARHICFAYTTGVDTPIFRSSDAGEPNGTAGLPILNQIKSFGVLNVMIVVVRYFGGVKLGASGLVNAYKTASRIALSNAEIEERPMTVYLRLHFPFERMNEIMKCLKEIKALIVSKSFENNDCTIEVAVLRSLSDKLLVKGCVV